MTIVIRHNDQQLVMDVGESVAVHLEEAIILFGKSEVPRVINTAQKCLNELRDEWNEFELAERERLNSDQKGG